MRILGERIDFIIEAMQDATPDAAGGQRAAAVLLEWLPGLARHRCSTGERHPFAEEIASTEVPHLFEHVVLELMTLSGSTGEVRGETVWRKDDDAYCVSVFDDDDLTCLAAARLAQRIIGAARAGEPEPGVEEGIAALKALRVTPNRHESEIDPR